MCGYDEGVAMYYYLNVSGITTNTGYIFKAYVLTSCYNISTHEVK